MGLAQGSGPRQLVGRVKEKMRMWACILRLKPGVPYVGSTTNLGRRFAEHQNGKGERTTRIDAPCKIVYSELCSSKAEAPDRELQIKRWTRANKEALIRGDMEELKRLS